ncbi:MAG: hypothetical protein HOP13_08980 [Alphaproteobacteria bacterium]|nr:hypothetical protein [Alphaproteobacteria bacterium]
MTLIEAYEGETRKRPLTLPMVRELRKLLDIPTEVLARAYPTRSAS